MSVAGGHVVCDPGCAGGESVIDGAGGVVVVGSCPAYDGQAAFLREAVDRDEQRLHGTAAAELGRNEQVVEVAARNAAQRADPVAQMCKALRLAGLGVVLVGRDGDERFGAPIVVDPTPDLALMLVRGRAVVEVGVAAKEPRSGVERVDAYRANSPDGHWSDAIAAAD